MPHQANLARQTRCQGRSGAWLGISWLLAVRLRRSPFSTATANLIPSVPQASSRRTPTAEQPQGWHGQTPDPKLFMTI